MTDYNWLEYIKFSLKNMALYFSRVLDAHKLDELKIIRSPVLFALFATIEDMKQQKLLDPPVSDMADMLLKILQEDEQYYYRFIYFMGRFNNSCPGLNCASVYDELKIQATYPFIR
jgi:hypothetical protein